MPGSNPQKPYRRWTVSDLDSQRVFWKFLSRAIRRVLRRSTSKLGGLAALLRLPIQMIALLAKLIIRLKSRCRRVAIVFCYWGPSLN
jgi:hypothetical protein